MTNVFLQPDVFQRPASYWLRRADRCKQNGDLLRAAVLERHALRTDPCSEEAAVSYVLTLRQLGCYEASNREAFAALARNPGRHTLFGLVGLNLCSMGLRKAGQDAFNIYLADPPPDFPPLWHDDAYDLACEGDRIPPRRRKARHDGLLRIAHNHIARADWPNAKRALERCSRTPYQGQSADRELTWALYHLQSGTPDCFEHLQNALLTSPFSSRIYAASASALWHSRDRKAAHNSLLCAAKLARSPADALNVLMCASELDALHLTAGMLRRMHRHTPNRTPVLYNLCLYLLKQGRLAEAVPLIDRARQIDPDDVQCELLFGCVMDLEQRACTMEQVRAAARPFLWHGLLSAQETNLIAAPITLALSQSPQELAEKLVSDLSLRRRFLMLLSIPASWHAGLLYTAVMTMEPSEREALLREVLLHHPAPSAAKDCAVSLLHQLGAQPPYASWQNDRLVWIDPTRPPEESAPFFPKHLTRRIHQAWHLCDRDPHAALWCMETVHRMNRRQRGRVIADHTHIWPMALAVRYRAIRGMEPLHLDFSRLGRGRWQDLSHALAVLRAISK